MEIPTLLQTGFLIAYETVNKLLQGCEQPCYNVVTRLDNMLHSFSLSSAIQWTISMLLYKKYDVHNLVI